MQTFTSFGTNLTNTYTSQSPSNKFRFNQRVSFFEEKTFNTTMTKTFYTSKEDLKQYILGQQEKCQWVDYAEFNNLEPGEVIVTLLSHYNSSYKSTGWDETIEEFNQKVESLVESVKRRFPFIKLLRKVPQEKALKTETFIQIQLYTAPSENQEKQTFVLFQTGVNEYNQLKPKILIDSIQLFLKKFTLIVQVDCENKDASALGTGGSLGNGSFLEGLKVTVRQREIAETQIQSPTKQIVIKTSLCNLSASKAEMRTSKIDLFKSNNFNRQNIYKANENLNLDKQVRVYFSPTKTQNWMTQTNISQGDLIHKDYTSSAKKSTVSLKKEPVKLFVQSVETNYLEQAIFPALVQQINNYEIEVSGQRIKTARTFIKIDQLLSNPSDQQLIVSLRVERNDITKCLVRVRKEGAVAKELTIKVSKDNPINQEGGYELINQFDEINGVYFFWGSINSQYFLEVSKKDCFTQQKEIFIQGVSHQPTLEFELVSCVQTQLWFKAFDVTSLNCLPLEGVVVNINQSEDEDQGTGTTLCTISSNNTNTQGSITGQTDKEGMFTCNGLMFKQLHITAKKTGFLSISYDYDVRSNSTGSVLTVPMMPDYYSLINQYHIIVYIPRRKDFKLEFSLKCPDNQIISEKNLKHKSQKTKVEIQKVGQDGRILNFQVHVQSLDPFLKNNFFQFIVVNQAPKRQMLCSPTRQQTGKSPTRQFVQPQETFLKTRISLKGDIVSPRKVESDIVAQKIIQYCAEESVRVFVTFGHEVIHTFMIQQSLLPTSNEKCYGVIDLDKRKFTFMEDTIQTQECGKPLKNLKIKNNKQEQQLPNNNLGQILSLITNQKIKVKE